MFTNNCVISALTLLIMPQADWGGKNMEAIVVAITDKSEQPEL